MPNRPSARQKVFAGGVARAPTNCLWSHGNLAADNLLEAGAIGFLFVTQAVTSDMAI